MTTITFEESIETINTEIIKRKNKWNLTVLAWMDFDDVSQIIRLHIYRKWHLYDQGKPLCPWLNRVISHQIRNIIRNVYGNHCRPCLRCAAAEGSDGCRFYVKQCNDCPIYAYWERNKKSAHDIKLPVPLENHAQEVSNMSNDQIDIEKTAVKIHDKMQTILKSFEWKVYKCLYIDHLDEEQTAKIMGYRTSEKGRMAGYKQLKNIKKSILSKVRKALNDGDIDIV
jgi:DNA-directed RNA polymerase specialized sigma24 family protein